jgi:hypothetical protein
MAQRAFSARTAVMLMELSWWEIVLRAVSNLLLSGFMIATLLWGGCVSCSQFFMFPGASKGCCNKAGQCERPGSTAPKIDCKRLPLALQRLGNEHADLPPININAAVEIEPAPALAFLFPVSDVLRVEHSPPDLHVLHSTFLI